jgi:6-phosphogluconolactonase
MASRSIDSNGRFTVALSGGSTPRGLYSVLASGAIPGLSWKQIYLFWSDERHVPPDDAESNYRMVQESLLSKVPVPAGNVFRVHAEEKDAATAAAQYEQTLRDFFAVKAGDFPQFDLILLGLGPEGHTASLFPDTAALDEKQRLVVANWVPKLNAQRITLTLPLINRASTVLFLAEGAKKAAIVHEVLEDPQADLPAQKVQPVSGRLLWMLDQAAANALQKKSA